MHPLLSAGPAGTTTALADRLAAGGARAALAFAGQGGDALDDLRSLLRLDPSARHAVDVAAAALAEAAAAEPLVRDSGLLRHPLDLGAWVDDPDAVPSAAYARSAAVSAPLVVLGQALTWRAVAGDGLAAALQAGTVTALAGHSLGVLGALMVGEAGGDLDDDVLARWLRAALVHGTCAQLAAPGLGAGSPMAAVGGVRVARLEALVAEVNARLRPEDRVVVALVNTRRRCVVSGPPAALETLRGHLEAVAAAEAADRRAGRRGGAPLQPTWAPLPVDVPYHALPAAAQAYAGWLRAGGLLPDPADLAAPVLSPADATDLREAGDLAAAVAAGQFAAPVRWDAVCGALAARGADWVLDLGPGTAVAQLTAEALRGTGVRTLGLAAPEGRRRLATPGAAPEGRDLAYTRFAPRVVELPDGRRHVATRFSDRLGRPPVVLAGMTPTTADAPIVAAAVNAGYAAELAGGGQPDAWTFERRIEELRELLDPGQEAVFNTMYLDRHLWRLHVEDEGLLLRARAAGAPLSGVTVSAGVPDADEAVALLERFAATGLHAVAFKPGTREQVERVLAIADAAPHRLVVVHLEGGLGGGHHSWEDLDELLLDTYDDLRRRDNVVLCVAGGIATPQDAAAYLTGTWARPFGEPDMPVDAVLLGTVAMACREACASSSVKAALVAAPGAEGWVPRGGTAGGVTSTRSNLNADIHLLDGAAARAAHLLEEVAGDPDAVRARRDEIVAALAQTAKPYLGDLREMTYAEALRALVARLATGRHGRYDDGAWGHPTWRSRALAVFRRAAARLDVRDEGEVVPPVAVGADLDDPQAALDRFLAACPRAATTLLDPADVQFVLEVCDRPGKPVPFVPVLDGEVRRWFMADALWQAQDDRLDAAQVHVIPGPRSVAGITRADEPVAELLRRFEEGVLDALAGEPVSARDRLAAQGVADLPLTRAAASAPGVVAALCVAPSVALAGGGTAPNPLWRLVAAGDALEVEHAEDGTIARLVARPPDAGEAVEVLADGDAAEVVVDLGRDLPPRRLRFRALGGGRVRLEQDAASDAAHAAAALGLDPAPAGLAPFSAPWRCPAGLAQAYGAATGAAHGGVPLDLAFTLAWPALGGVLAGPELAPRLGDLLHAGHAVRPGPAWPPAAGEEGVAQAAITGVDDDPATLRCTTRLTSARGLVAEVDSELVLLDGGAAPRPGGAAVAGDPPVGDAPPVGTSAAASPSPVEGASPVEDASPVEACAAASFAPRRVLPRPVKPLAEAEDLAPLTMDAFARIGGDRNPLHRSVLAARAAGFPAPVVHGAWTAARAGAFVVDAVCAGDASALRDWRVRFLAPVPCGAVLVLRAERVGLRAGRLVVAVHVSADDVPVATAEAEVAWPPTALTFPGQGVQRAGLGAEGRGRSAAAREVWERADRHTREHLGFSLLEVVEANPPALRLASGAVARHPSGVLFRTELTQPALVALAAAQVAELRAEEVVGEEVVAAGHSVGELSALVALGVLSLEDALGLAHVRGLAMQRHVARDASGASAYGLAVVDPSRAGLTPAALDDAVGAAAQGEVLEVVNHNALGRQYAVAGTTAAIGRLAAALGGRAVRTVPGIDVPFHSSLLAPAVADLRAALAARLGPVDPARLAGRWVPNLLGRPFALDDDVLDEVRARTGEAVDAADPAERCRQAVVALVAHQLAAPVLWIDTVLALTAAPAAGGLGVRRLLEVGPGHATVLTGLARTTLDGRRDVVLHHAEADRDAVRELDAPVVVAAEEAEAEAAPSPEPSAARAAAPAGGAPSLPDEPLDAGAALRLVLAVQARVRPDQLGDGETIDDLFQGVSSRRNQVLIDLGRELALSGAEGVQGQPVGELAAALSAHGTYRHPGPYLRDVVAAGVTRALGRAGLTRADAVAHLERGFGLGPGAADRVLATLALETREGPSGRGGPLGRLAADLPGDRAGGLALVERAAQLAGVPLVAREAPAAPVADPAAVARVEAVVRDAARRVADALGVPEEAPAAAPADDLDRLAALDTEHGAGRAAEVAPRFDAARHVRLLDAGATARWELVAAYHAVLDDRAAPDAVAPLALHAADPALQATAQHLAGRAEALGRPELAAALRGLTPRRPALRPEGVRADGTADAARPDDLLARLRELARDAAPDDPAADGPDPHARLADVLATDEAPDLAHHVALVTGAAPGSIAGELVRGLLRGGATVVATASDLTPQRRRWARDLFREAAAPGAELHLLPANLASFTDIDALVAWLAAPGGARRGRPELALPPLRPTLVAPFAAVPTAGDLDGASAAAEVALRVQLLGVQRLVGALADPDAPVTVLLPLSPNHGDLGGDGVYSETKAALEVALRRWHAEQATWGRGTRLLAPRIGWVRGTGLMGANDAAAVRAERDLGIRTASAAEMGWLLTGLADPRFAQLAAAGPVRLDLTGGLGAAAEGEEARVLAQGRVMEGAARGRAVEGRGVEGAARGRVVEDVAAGDVAAGGSAAGDAPPEPALPAPERRTAAPPVPDGPATLDPRDLVVIVGTGELGPGGTSATRTELERGGPLSPRAVAELAWACGLVEARREGYALRWVDVASGQEVAEADLASRYRDEVRRRVGLRPLHDDGTLHPDGHEVLAPVPTSEPTTFVVDDAELAATFAGDGVTTRELPDGRVEVTRPAGALVRVPRRVAHTRRVVGQLPEGLDLVRLGVPADLAAGTDRMALVNLVCSAAAFDDAGLSPEELLGHVHPALVGNTQGAGMGGMASLRLLLLDLLLDRDRQTDRLQESLGNVVAAHVVQGLVGSYGPMVHPVAACATAAVSLEEAFDKIRLGKALAVLAGGYDDLTPEGVLGFADMGATADGAALEAAGLAPDETSRPNDLRRSGFVESQGGGALLCVRGDVALELGLPVRGVLLHAQSAGDGIHASIPAPGLGVLSVALGGARSPLGEALRRHGLTPDDVGVVSKHDTSTELNDPNEADLHERVQEALGRSPGAPLLVVSQKAVTGHAKGGAAAWQVDGVLRAMEDGVVPGNPNLECVDPLVRDTRWLALGDRPLATSAADPVRAALVTSLGFGHVSALLALGHPDLFLRAVPEEERAAYAQRAARRRAAGERDRRERRLGLAGPLRRQDRRLGDGDAAAVREREAAVLLDPDARLHPDGLR